MVGSRLTQRNVLQIIGLVLVAISAPMVMGADAGTWGNAVASTGVDEASIGTTASEAQPPGGILSGTINLSDADTEFVSENASDRAGRSVTGVGDVNGDGHADVAIGVPRDDSMATNAGGVYLFYGPVDEGDIELSAADAVLTGVSAGDWAGFSVASGDVDGDGLDDLIVGAPKSDANGTDAGAAYVVYGNRSLSGRLSLSEASTRFTGERAKDAAGYSVAAAANLTPGVGGVIVGAPYNDDGGEDAGAAYVLSVEERPTSSTSLGEADSELIGTRAGDLAGWSVADAGDVNGDDQHEVVVGARRANTSASNAGAAYVIADALDVGEPSLANADVRLLGVAKGDNAGFSVASAGDVNGDGLDDVLVGAPFNDTEGATNAGAAYVVYGSESLANQSLANADLALRGEARNDRAGWSVSPAGSGDVSCDQYGDVLVGAPGRDASTGANAGVAYLVHGGSDQRHVNLANADATLVGENAGDQAGFDVSEAGDVSSDDREDVLVGAPYNDGGGEDAGAAYALFGECPVEEERAPKTPTTTEEEETPGSSGNVIELTCGEVTATANVDFVLTGVRYSIQTGETVTFTTGTYDAGFTASLNIGDRFGSEWVIQEVSVVEADTEDNVLDTAIWDPEDCVPQEGQPDTTTTTTTQTTEELDVDIDNSTCEQVRVTVNSAPSRLVENGEVRITLRLNEPQVLGQEQVVAVGETAVFDNPHPEYPVPVEETTTGEAVPGTYGVYVGGEFVDFVVVDACDAETPPPEEPLDIDIDTRTCEEVGVMVNSAPSRLVENGEVRITVRLSEPQVLGQEQVVAVGEMATFENLDPGVYDVYVGGEYVDTVVVSPCEPPVEEEPAEEQPPEEEEPPEEQVDSDGDGVVDANDQCPDESGPAENNGCPVDDSSDGESTTVEVRG